MNYDLLGEIDSSTSCLYSDAMNGKQDIEKTAPQSDLAETFQNQKIHDRWEATYRNCKPVKMLNDRIVARFVNGLPNRGSLKVLDAGCGVGDHTIRFARRGHTCVGIDLSQEILQQAERNAIRNGLADLTTFRQLGLEDLSQLDGEFDVIHCRGVLMHIPNWRLAVDQLCKTLKPGGRMLIMENNHRSIELILVRALRAFRKSSRTIRWSEDGAEFLDSKDGYAPLTRIANLTTLSDHLASNGVEVVSRFATQFVDINRFPKGILQNSAARLNSIYFRLRLPALLSIENAIVGQKIH